MREKDAFPSLGLPSKGSALCKVKGEGTGPNSDPKRLFSGELIFLAPAASFGKIMKEREKKKTPNPRKTKIPNPRKAYHESTEGHPFPQVRAFSTPFCIQQGEEKD